LYLLRTLLHLFIKSLDEKNVNDFYGQNDAKNVLVFFRILLSVDSKNIQRYIRMNKYQEAVLNKLFQMVENERNVVTGYLKYLSASHFFFIY